jgi:hypothetical protein
MGRWPLAAVRPDWRASVAAGASWGRVKHRQTSLTLTAIKAAAGDFASTVTGHWGTIVTARRQQMDNSGVLERVKVREVAGVFPSRTAALAAMDDLLLAGSDRADIAVAEGECLRNRTGGIPIPAVELADMPGTPWQELVAPEDIAAVIALCVAIMSCIGAMIGAASAIASGGTTTCMVIYVIIGAILGCGLGM